MVYSLQSIADKVSKGIENRSLGEETEAKTVAEGCLLPCPATYLILFVLYKVRGSSAQGQDNSYQFTIKKVPPQTHPLANVMKAISQLRFSILI